MIAELESGPKKMQEELDYLKKTGEEAKKLADLKCSIQLDGQIAKYNSLDNSRKEQIGMYQTALKQVEKKWYENPYLNFVIGGLVVGAASVGVYSLTK